MAKKAKATKKKDVDIAEQLERAILEMTQWANRLNEIEGFDAFSKYQEENGKFVYFHVVVSIDKEKGSHFFYDG